MTDVIDDTETIYINVTYPEGIANITNVVFPLSVVAGEAFEITYDVTNTSSWEDTLWGGLFIESVPGSGNYDTLVAGTGWSQLVAAGQTISKTISFPDGITEPLDAVLKAGHVE